MPNAGGGSYLYRNSGKDGSKTIKVIFGMAQCEGALELSHILLLNPKTRDLFLMKK